MARIYRRRGYRRRYGYRRGAPYGIDPLFWVALGIALLVVLVVVSR